MIIMIINKDPEKGHWYEIRKSYLSMDMNTYISLTLLELLVGAPPVKYWLIDVRWRKALKASIASCLVCTLSFRSLHISLISSAFNIFAYSSKLKLLMPITNHSFVLLTCLLYNSQDRQCQCVELTSKCFPHYDLLHPLSKPALLWAERKI